jgi:transcriptional regulator with XRE-family HTH domain
MARKFRDLIADWPPERTQAVEASVREMLRDTPLLRLRVALGLSSDELASALGKTPNHVRILERRADHFLSSARKYVEAMGGRLEITARFPDREYRLDRVRGEPGGEWEEDSSRGEP